VVKGQRNVHYHHQDLATRPQRGERVIHGRSEAAWLVKLEKDTPSKPWRRVYRDWTQLDKRGSEDSRNWIVPLVLVIKGEVITLTAEHRAQPETYVKPRQPWED
jgi:hypothetical protein